MEKRETSVAHSAELQNRGNEWPRARCRLHGLAHCLYLFTFSFILSLNLVLFVSAETEVKRVPRRMVGPRQRRECVPLYLCTEPKGRERVNSSFVGQFSLFRSILICSNFATFYFCKRVSHEPKVSRKLGTMSLSMREKKFRLSNRRECVRSSRLVALPAG